MKVYTDGSAKQHGGWGCYIEVGDDEIHHGYGGCGLGATNNYAEASALLEALRYYRSALKPVKKITIYSDSKYVIAVYKGLPEYAERNWHSHKGKEIAHKNLWVDIYHEANHIDAEIVFEWVKGHSGVAGNEAADVLASRGADIDSPAPTKPIWRKEDLTKKVPKAEPLHPGLTGKRWYMVTNRPAQDDEGNYVYFSTTYSAVNGKKGSTKDQRLQDHIRLAGSRDPTNHHGILFTKNPIPVLETFRTAQNKHTQGEQLPNLTWLDKISVKKVWDSLNDDSSSVFHRKRDMLVTGRNDVLSTIVNPPRNIWKLDGLLEHVVQIKAQLDKGSSRFHCVDVTDTLFVTNDKKVYVANEALEDAKSMVFKGVKVGTRSLDISLTPGVDIPNVTQLNRVVRNRKTLEGIKFSIVVYDLDTITEKKPMLYSYRVLCRLEYEGDTVIWFTDDANLRVQKEV